MAASERVAKALGVTAEVMQQEMSAEALAVMTDDLAAYPEPAVLAAIHRVRQECSRLTLAAVIERLDDGRPGPEEAWAMIPRTEDQTAVWTEEMRAGWRAAAPLLEEGDRVAARMAFLECYRDELRRARAAGVPAKWTVSLGHDASTREAPVLQAVERGWLTAAEAAFCLPASDALLALTAADQAKLLGPDGEH